MVVVVGPRVEKERKERACRDEKSRRVGETSNYDRREPECFYLPPGNVV